MQLVTPPWQVDLHGTIAQPLQLQGVAADVSLTRLTSEQPSDHGQAASSQEPYKLTGHLTQEGDGWAVRGLAGTLGTSDLRGDIFVEMQEKRPLVRAAFLAPLGCVTCKRWAPPAHRPLQRLQRRRGRRPASASYEPRADAGGRCPAALRGPDGADGPSNSAQCVHGSGAP